MYTLEFNNDMLNLISNDCGLVIAPDNQRATTEEVEFFAEKIIEECISVVDEKSQQAIRNHFAIRNYYNNENQLELFKDDQ